MLLRAVSLTAERGLKDRPFCGDQPVRINDYAELPSDPTKQAIEGIGL